MRIDQESELDIREGLLRSSPSHRTIVLGAGFSIAVNPAHMPTTDELGNRAVAIANHPEAPIFRDGRFEAWLSRLAEAQPDLTPVQNARNRSTFLALTEAIHAVLTAAQAGTLAGGAPRWL